MPDRVPDPTKKPKADPNVGLRGDDATRLIYIPWTAADDEEFADKSAQWNAAAVKNGRPANRFTIVHYQEGKKIPALVEISKPEHSDAVIYIRGHGSPGVPYVQMRNSKNESKSKLPIKDVCKRLMENGLASTFTGVIKFYSCYSGTKLTKEALKQEKEFIKQKNKELTAWNKAGDITDEVLEQMWKSDVKDASLGGLGADYLRKKGFKKAIFYAYLGPLSSEYTDDPGDSKEGERKLVKTVVVDPQLKMRPEDLEGQYEVRASKGRIQV